MKHLCKQFIVTLTLIVGISMFLFTQTEQPATAAKVEPQELQIGMASWYSKRSPGINKRTANNEIFDDQAMTAAMWDVPFNQKVRVTNMDNGNSIIVRINDRGPHKRFGKRVIDLTKKAFSRLGTTKNGLIRVKVEFL